ncbi:glutathione S-transferase family protein [Oharaeibacter diazotrophicus]|uniref:Glutathione S-transferase n=1 Tax=Oharaeibacter diazotrophicus TaxID=1920512 RepID=A0A4R6R9M6_9HYPH|nr:glutathione S-transferase family protein [Oharaeibacter diazotrophicus]TDP82634.1 glutathione S-transferase [Oharaeibacter diazotrophicus]BBE72602.1 putative GST-like protein YibF [Pleomorphomonas sp. SM30]GLS76636.1 glutathione S-transferase [Oharaeibacter diazotrophicus]
MTDFVLRSSPPSPFGRKVKIAAAVLGLSDRITVKVTDTNDPADSIRRENPLGKIPALITADGTCLYDSRVIVEYLDHVAGGGRILPTDPAERFPALVLQATADGIMDAAILRRYEVAMRAEGERSAKWDAHQVGKIERAVAALEAAPPPQGRVWIGDIALACALGYLDFRFDGTWRAEHPRLVEWLDAFAAAVPAFEATRVKV